MMYSPASSSSSSSSTRSSPVHAASLVDPATHSPALLQLVDIKLSKSVVDYVVDCVVETVDFAMGRSSGSSPRGRAAHRSNPYIAPFTSFVSTVLSRAEVAPATVLVALVYTARARPHLSIALEEWALERVFLGALICASKYTNDSTLKNVHWALCTGVFGKRDVGRIEREFLDVLDWELGVREADVLAHHQGLMEAAYPRRATHRKTLSGSSTSSASSSEFLAVPAPAGPRRTHHRRTSSHTFAVPDLTPSSPSSSSTSLSPRTPAHLAFPPAPAPAKPHHAHPADVPMDVDGDLHARPVPAHAAHGKWNDLIRSFPIPLPRTHHARPAVQHVH